MNWLNGISITCFAASYLVVLGLELSKVYFRAPLRKILSLTMLVAGLFAHAVFIFLQTGAEGLVMGSWSGWILATAWILMATYLWIFLRQSQSLLGVLIIPMVLGMVFIGSRPYLQSGFTGQTKSVWGAIHGSSLLLGTAVVAIGCLMGIMYLVHSYRLKNKLPPLKRFRFPSLERLQRAAEFSLFASTMLLGLGLLSGIAVNMINRKTGTTVLAWTDPVVWSSGILFGWLMAISVFSLVYRPARQGRKVAYLVVASFAFLLLELGIAWSVGHGHAGDTLQGHACQTKSQTLTQTIDQSNNSLASDPSSEENKVVVLGDDR